MSTSDKRMNHFLLLTPDEQRAAIKRLATSGMSDYGIAAATGLGVEQVRLILLDEPRTNEEQEL